MGVKVSGPSGPYQEPRVKCQDVKASAGEMAQPLNARLPTKNTRVVKAT